MIINPLYNLLPVETFREHIAYNAFHFWGLAGDKAPVNSACNTAVAEYASQMADAGGREDIRLAIIEAEKKFKSHLGYWTRSKYIQETINLGCFMHFGPDLFDEYPEYSYCYRPGYSTVVRLDSGQVTAVQTETMSLLAGGASVTYTDDDADGNLDRFEVLITDSTSDPATIDLELRFLAADVPFSWKPERRKIEPIYIDRKDGTHIRIQGPAWVMVAPKKYGGFNLISYDPAVSSNFVQTADVYLKTVTNSGAASFLYYDSANVLQTLAVDVDICNADLGLARISTNQCINFCNCGTNRNQTFSVNYRAGAEAGLFDAEVTRLALAEMRRRVCACDEANGELYAWQVDMAMPAGASMARIHLDPSDLANPIGTRAGQMNAWKKIQLYRQAHGIFAG